MGLLLCSKSCDDYRTVAKLCDDFAEAYPVLPTVQHLTLKGMIALIGYTNNPSHSYRFVLESGCSQRRTLCAKRTSFLMTDAFHRMAKPAAQSVAQYRLVSLFCEQFRPQTRPVY